MHAHVHHSESHRKYIRVISRHSNSQLFTIYELPCSKDSRSKTSRKQVLDIQIWLNISIHCSVEASIFNILLHVVIIVYKRSDSLRKAEYLLLSVTACRWNHVDEHAGSRWEKFFLSSKVLLDIDIIDFCTLTKALQERNSYSTIFQIHAKNKYLFLSLI